MVRWIKQFFIRRRIEKNLIAFAKTKQGRVFIEAMHDGNQILADYDAYILGAERTSIPNKKWRLLNVR